MKKIFKRLKEIIKLRWVKLLRVFNPLTKEELNIEQQKQWFFNAFKQQPEYIVNIMRRLDGGKVYGIDKTERYYDMLVENKKNMLLYHKYTMKTPRIVNFDIIDTHNEFLNENAPTIEVLKNVDIYKTKSDMAKTESDIRFYKKNIPTS